MHLQVEWLIALRTSKRTRIIDDITNQPDVDLSHQNNFKRTWCFDENAIIINDKIVVIINANVLDPNMKPRQTNHQIWQDFLPTRTRHKKSKPKRNYPKR